MGGGGVVAGVDVEGVVCARGVRFLRAEVGIVLRDPVVGLYCIVLLVWLLLGLGEYMASRVGAGLAECCTLGQL